MDIYFANSALGAECNSKAALARRWGPERGVLVEQQLTELQALDCLDDYLGLPHVEARATRQMTTLRTARDLVIVVRADQEATTETQRLTVVAVEERAEESWDQ
jgi:hypothetical protein